MTQNANTSITDADRIGGHTSGVRRILVLLVLGVLVPLAPACGGDDDEEGSPAGGATTAATTTEATGPSTTEAAPSTSRVAVYFLRGEKLGVGAREAEGQAVARAALEALLAGPSAAEREAGLGTSIPDGTRLLDLAIADGTATVDLSGEYGTGGGSLSMLTRVAQVVATLTQFPTVERVAFRLDGEPVDAIGGEGVLVDPPVTRADIEGQTPAILVESPAAGETVSDPLRIRGTANTFEATFQVKVVDASGRELYRNFVTATSGSGERGTFDEQLDLPDDAAGEITLTVYEDNMGEGEGGGSAVLHQVDVPLVLER